jgi:hypothetical protein
LPNFTFAKLFLSGQLGAEAAAAAAAAEKRLIKYRYQQIIQKRQFPTRRRN